MDASEESRFKVAIIGTAGAGKTCFIAAMRWLGEGGGDGRFTSVGADGDTKKFLDDLHDKVKVGEVPSGSPNEIKLEFSERYASSPDDSPVQIDFSMRDFKGGDLHDLDSNSELLKSWMQCNLLMVFLDVEKVQRGGVDLQDNLRDLSSVLTRNEMGAPEKRLAIVVTQADKGGFSEGRHAPEDAEKFVRERLPDFFERIKTCGFKETRCFLLASIGSTPEMGPDGKSRVAEVNGSRWWRPFGYGEVFDWVCAFQREDERTRFWEGLWKRAKPLVAVLAVAALACVTWLGWVVSRQQGALRTYSNENSSWSEKAAATWKMSGEDCRVVADELISEYESRLKDAHGDNPLRDLLRELDRFFNVKREKGVKGAKTTEEQSRRVDEIVRGIRARLEEGLVSKIRNAMQDGDAERARRLIKEYRDAEDVERRHEEEIGSYERRIRDKTRRTAMQKIASMDVGPAGNTFRMNAKLEAIEAFKYPDDGDRTNALKAVAAMRSLMRGEFLITEIIAEELEEKRNTYVMIATDVGEGKPLKEVDEEWGVSIKTEIVDSKNPQWNGSRMGRQAKLVWRPGQAIRVEWCRKSLLSDRCIASLARRGDDWLGLLEILQPQAEMYGNDYQNFNPCPKITIRCLEFEDSANDLKLIWRFVYPGDYWKNDQG